MAETLAFQAEVKQLLDLVVHSLYSNKEIFLRELVSNASDAIDRARLLGLTQSDLRAAEGEPGIEIEADKDRGVLIVRDNGIGLTRDQAIEHLGTIARSGTKAFAQALKDKGDSADGLIGQFGVGFYSSFMVASRVEVHSLSAEPGSEPVMWSSDGSGEFTIEPGSRSTRGTTVTLHMRSDALSFLDDYTVRDIVKRHSAFVAYPVKFKDEQINEPHALWMKNPSEVTDDEYKAFSKQALGEWQEPLSWVHFRAEAPLEYQAVLFFPSSRPHDLDYPDGKRGLRLYQRRVLIKDASDEFLPRYLRFIKGVVDAPEVSLNVSREILQQTPVLRSIKNQVVKRVLRRLRELGREDVATYTKFWEEFGITLKEGVAEDHDNREALTPLLRFRTTTGGDEWRDLAQIKSDMKEGQKEIGYLTGLDLGRLRASPQLERWKKKGWEVILLSDPVDEWVTMNLTEFDGVPLSSVAKGEIEADDDPIAEEARKQVEPFADWVKELLGDAVSGVRPSRRLTDSPAVLVDEGQLSANLERILRAAKQGGPKAQRTLELNPEHALVQKLAAMHRDGNTAGAEPLARLLLDYAQLAEGHVEDVTGLTKRLAAVMLSAAG